MDNGCQSSINALPEIVNDPEHQDFEAISSLRRMAPGPWRSLGRYLDYTDWVDRQRFFELDRAIESMPKLREDVADQRRPVRAARSHPTRRRSAALSEISIAGVRRVSLH